jgi:hypothetical protein
MTPRTGVENNHPRSPMGCVRGARRSVRCPLSARGVSTQCKVQGSGPRTFSSGRMSANRPRSSSESGKTLVLALVILGMATLLIGTFMFYVSTSQRVTRAAIEQITSHYSADAGIEHAMWRLANEPGFADAVALATSAGGAEVYTFELNEQTVVVSVTTISEP